MINCIETENIRAEISELVKKYSNIVFRKEKFIAEKTVIPPSGKLIDHNDLSLMVEAVLDGWLTTGRFNEEFEKRLAKFLNVKKVLTVNSGSSANLIAFNTLTNQTLGDRAIKKGDEVISVAAGFPTTVNPIIQYGAVPVFIDVDIGTYNINIDDLENAINKKTKAIMLAHTLGNPFNLNEIKRICEKYNLWLVEDCCDALGSTYNGKIVGSFGDIGTLSFYPAHHITMGEGGAVFMNDSKLKKIAESLRDWGRDCFCPPGKDNTCRKRFCWKLGDLPEGYDHKYIYSNLGYNLKITDIQAACGLSQLDKIDKFIKKRKINFAKIYEKLNSYNEYFILPEITKNAEPSWFGFPITIKKNSILNRSELIQHLDKHKIGTRLLFAGNLTKQPYMKNVNYRIFKDLKNTDLIMNNTFWIGLHPSISLEHIEYVDNVIGGYIKRL